MAIPSHKLIQVEGGNGIEIGDWMITASKKNISNAEELETASKELNLKVLPEMLFVSYLKLTHKNGFSLSFDPKSALKEVAPQCDIKVSYSKEWLQSKASLLESSNIKRAHDYDWTFTTAYRGSIHTPASTEEAESEKSHLGVPQSTTEHIDIEKLKRPDPILYFTEIPLYEDELSDNGDASLSVKIRVMPGSFFILLRYWLRIDEVVFRSIDTRYYHEFDTNFMLRELIVKESHWSNIVRMLPPDQPTKVTDVNLVSSLMTKKAEVVEKIQIKQ